MPTLTPPPTTSGSTDSQAQTSPSSIRPLPKTLVEWQPKSRNEDWRKRHLRPSQPTASENVPLTPFDWEPQPGPQTEAFECEADEILYGGSAGSGKSDILLGLALRSHRRSIIFRREYKQLSALVERSRELIEDKGTFNGTANIWRLQDGRSLEFGACEHEHHWRKWRGRPHDLKAFDELTEFTELQYISLIAWARTTVPGQRVQVIGATNPPSGPEGEWVIQRWGPWLDEQHPNPAEPGELRWYTTIEGKDTAVESPEPFEHNGEMLYPKSRTFIPARLEDNPILEATGYRSTLQLLPEPLRSQLLYGDWKIGLKDDARQVIPTAWVMAAQNRWSEENRPVDESGVPIEWTAIGIDVAGGGADRTVLSRRCHDWFAELEIHEGKDTPDAEASTEIIQLALVEGGVGNIDIDGIGASTYYLAKGLHLDVAAYQGSAPTKWRDRSKKLEFANVRAAAYWSFRDALDPAHHSKIALPPDRNLRVELCAPRYALVGGKVQLEKKKDIKERLSRSPDLADAVVQALWIDPRAMALEHVGKTTSMVRTPSEQPASTNVFGERNRMPVPIRKQSVGRRRR